MARSQQDSTIRDRAKTVSPESINLSAIRVFKLSTRRRRESAPSSATSCPKYGSTLSLLRALRASSAIARAAPSLPLKDDAVSLRTIRGAKDRLAEGFA
jgi:hypothetical protein